MKFKVDESAHPAIAVLLRDRGYDAVTVWDQELRGAPDVRLMEVCRAEGRALVTFDLGFGDIRRYPPVSSPGVIVLRLGSQARDRALEVVERLIPLLPTQPLTGRLWVVSESDVRMRGGAVEARRE